MLRHLFLLALGSGLALCLDLETVQRTSHFPVPTTSMHRKRSESREDLQDMGDKERLYYQLLSSRMAKLLPSLLREADLGRDAEEDLDGGQDKSASGVPEQEADEVMMYLPKRRVVHPSRSMQDVDSSPVYGVRKRMPVLKRRLRYQDFKDEKRKRSTRRFKDAALRKKSASSKPSRKKMLQSPDKKSVFRAVQQLQKQQRNATQKTDSKAPGQATKKYNIMKRSSGSDEKVLGELRSIFSEDSKADQKKTVKKREDSAVAPKSGDGSSDSSKAESDEDKFKKWLLDEYYRTMALSFASMRKKRMAVHQDTLDLRKMKRDDQQADDQFQAVEEKLRTIEDAMIGEALELVRDGAGDESDLRAINAGVASRLDAAYDLESVRQSLGHLESTLDEMRRREDTDDDGGQQDDVDDRPRGSWAQFVDKEAHSLIPTKKRQEEEVLAEPGCPALQVLSSGCAPLEDLTAFDASLETEVLSACSWHQVCYTCGSFFGLTSDDCDEGLGVANPQLARLVLNYLLRRQVFFKRSTPALCSTSCVSDFLLNH